MDGSATGALEAQKVTEWAFPRETEGIVKAWLTLAADTWALHELLYAQGFPLHACQYVHS